MEKIVMPERHTPDPDGHSQDVNVFMSSGLLGDRIDQLKVSCDRDHPSSQSGRHFRKHLEIPKFPDIVIVLVVRMAAATFSTSILIEVVRNDISGKLVWIVGIFSASFLLALWFYCARAISTQPHLKWGVLYLWFSILFGSVLGAIYD
jgi:hypothetical protein